MGDIIPYGDYITKNKNSTDLYRYCNLQLPLKNIADTNQGFADRLKKSFDTKSLRWQDLNHSIGF